MIATFKLTFIASKSHNVVELQDKIETNTGTIGVLHARLLQLNGSAGMLESSLSECSSICFTLPSV